MSKSEIEEIIDSIIAFRDERDWEKFHTGKDIAMCLNIESSELLEAFLWKKDGEEDIKKIEAELADVFYSAFLLSNKYGLNVKQIVLNKLEENKRKYPVDKSKGVNRKYNEF